MTNQTKTNTRKRSGIGLAFFASLFLIAGSASAASDMNKNYSSTQPNPCNGDSVAFSGSQHTVSNNKTDKDGTQHMNFQTDTHGNGIGMPSGLQYTVGQQMKVVGKFPPGPVMFRQRTKVVSSGPADNFFETFIFRFNEDGTPGQNDFESDCRG